MSSVGDLTVNITSDTSGLTSGMTDARTQLNQTTTVIQRQEQSWLSFAGKMAHGTLSIVGSYLSYITAQRVAATATAHTATAQVALATASANAAAAQATLATATIGAAAGAGVAAPATLALAAAEVVAIPPSLTLAGAMAFIFAPLTLIIIALALVAAAWYFFAGSAEEATDSTAQASQELDTAGGKLSQFGEMARKAERDALKQADALKQLQSEAKKAGKTIEGMNEKLSAVDIQKMSIQGSLLDEATSKELSHIQESIGAVNDGMVELRAVISQPFIDVMQLMPTMIGMLLGLSEKLENVAGFAKRVENAFGSLTNYMKQAQTRAMEFLHSWRTGASDKVSKQFIADGVAITERAARSEKAMAILMAQSVAMGQYRTMMDAASASAKANTEAERVRSITSIAGINAEITAFQNRSAKELLEITNRQQVAKGTGNQKRIKELDEEYDAMKKRQAAEGGTLAAQKEGIETGKIKPMGTEAVDSARKAFEELKLGHDEFVIAQMRANAVTDEQKASVEALIPELRQWNEATRQLTEQNKNIKAAGDAFRKMAEDSEALEAKGVDKIAELKDEINLLNGSATEAEIAMRKLAEAGYSEEQVAMIGELTAQRDKLKEKSKSEKKTKEDRTDLKAAFSGSSEAASIMLRGVGAKGGNEAQQIANRQLMVQQQLLAATKANKPPVTQTAVV